MLDIAKKQGVNNLVIYNFPIALIFEKAGGQITVTNYYAKALEEILNSYNFHIGFDILRYSNYHALFFISEVVLAYSRRVLLSGGMRYKTDLKSYNGNGLKIYENQLSNREIVKRFIGSEEIIQNVLRNNILNLFAWKNKKQEKKIVVFWKCGQCQKEQEDSVQSFRKFGLQFCCIKCLKSYKF